MRNVITRPKTLFASHYLDVRVIGSDEAIATQLRESGLVTVDGLTSRKAILAFASRLMAITPHPHSAPDGLTTILDTGVHAHRAGFAGLGSGELDAHTERAGVPAPPRLMLLACLRTATEGGDVLLADGRDILAGLSSHDREAAVMLAKPRTAYFGAGAGHASRVFTIHADNRVSIRLRQDGLARWSPIAQPYLPALRREIADCQHRLPLLPGQGYVVDNHRWLHARTRFWGDRLCWRALGQPRFSMARGFVPAPETVPPPARSEAG
ncbi:TauD/TfdA family dioxygenase [Streptomyces phaeochromogenes]|uniref:TauD/TfdA family dioxygenase n=1 Tax=Streptomyces phaeochromogenes TaxID=1923 RepID=UPI00398CC967